MRDPDPHDDALRWEGDDDPTLAPGWKTVGSPVPTRPEPTTASGDDGPDTDGKVDADADATTVADAAASHREVDDADAGDDAVDEAAPAPAQIGSVELVVLGVLAGVYLLYTIGWLISALRTSSPGVSIVSDFMYSLGLWLAVLAAPCWFALALRSRGRRSRLIWLIAGVVVLAPLPFVLGVTA
ncbi:DNA polymerase III subunit gamma/tau [Agromyces sp. Marseille-Q5079]|uniref:DNA polymerase III subunit gamma/tau n=1 Tax=Agromyces sp. Marseille-Q5079 TaxID=3439059 RepID=UPI003D9C973E